MYVEENYIREDLCDSGANVNFMSLKKVDELGSLKMSPYHKTTKYANGQNEMAVGIVYDFPINIGVIDFSSDIVIANNRDKYDFSIILGKLFSGWSYFGWRIEAGYHQNPKGISGVRCDLSRV